MDKPNSNLKTTVGIYSKRGGIQTITALIPAKDEEKNIAKCIESLKWCDRIIVLWMGTDRTGKIAQKMGVEVVKKNTSKHDNFKLLQENINWAIDNCSTNWILRIDADETLTPELSKEIVSLLHGPIGTYKQNNKTVKQSDNQVVA